MLYITRNTIALAHLITLTTICYGYRLGPPLNACADMFPQGHGASAQKTKPPFIFILNATQYSPGSVINVTLNATSDVFMEGVMIQARTLNCRKDDSIGTFSVVNNDDFLKPYDCFGKPASALGHYSHLHVFSKTFYWKAPVATSGPIYFRATVARNKAMFWMDVFSSFISDTGNQTGTDLETCQVQYSRNAASTSSLQVLLFAISIVIAKMG